MANYVGVFADVSKYTNILEGGQKSFSTLNTPCANTGAN